MQCPLCLSTETKALSTKNYWACSNCSLIYKDQSIYLSAAAEKARYATHNNDLSNPGYKDFLWPAVEAIKQFVAPQAAGLDYGNGPTIALAELLEQESYTCATYDPFFKPKDLEQFRDLDYVVSTEAAEHFYKPHLEFEKIFSLLNAKGVLVLMTELCQESTDLTTWYYSKDPTHVVFYSKASLQWLADKYSKNLKVLSHRLVVFTPKC